MRWLEYVVFLAIVVGLATPVGLYLARVCERQHTFADPIFSPVERLLYRLLGVRPEREMPATVYILCFLLFSAGCTVLLFLLLMLQRWLPGGPSDSWLTTPMTTDLAANTAVSFTTTTTWQAYSGESTLRYLAQVFGLVAQNFLAGAAGLAAGFAFIRGIARERSATIGNFWVDLIRSLLWVLLPAALIGSLVLIWQGVPLNMAPYTVAHTLEGRTQTISAGTSGRARVHQEPGDQRRRLLQCKWRTSLRESDAVHELPRDACDGAVLACVADGHARARHAQPERRMVVADDHGRAVHDWPRGVRLGGDRDAAATGRLAHHEAPTWRGRKYGSASVSRS